MHPVFPPKLRAGSHLRVVAPARSRALITDDNARIAEKSLSALGLSVSYGEHVDERDRYDSSAIASRIADLHAAFADPQVDAILTVIGGANSNELLPHLDFDLIAANPKILCGYSDITALQNAITAMTGLVTYYGPHWSTFGMRDLGQQTAEWFRGTLMSDGPIEVSGSEWFSDDLWFLDQDDRTTLPTGGWWSLQPGTAEGRIVGGNLCTLNLLQGTRWMPSLSDAVLMLEDDEASNPTEFRRDLHSLLQQPGAETVRGLVIGRFQQASEVVREDLRAMLETIPNLAGKPVLANVDFGHTNPLLTLPIGGEVAFSSGPTPSLTLVGH